MIPTAAEAAALADALRGATPRDITQAGIDQAVALLDSIAALLQSDPGDAVALIAELEWLLGDTDFWTTRGENAIRGAIMIISDYAALLQRDAGEAACTKAVASRDAAEERLAQARAALEDIAVAAEHEAGTAATGAWRHTADLARAVLAATASPPEGQYVCALCGLGVNGCSKPGCPGGAQGKAPTDGAED